VDVSAIFNFLKNRLEIKSTKIDLTYLVNSVSNNLDNKIIMLEKREMEKQFRLLKRSQLK
jgi:hypothetical protein